MRWSLPLGMLGIAPRARPRTSPHRPPRGLPAVELLEDRAVPSTLPVLGSPSFIGVTTRPFAASDWADTDGATPVAISVLANDSAVAGARLLPASVTVAAVPLHGGASVNRLTGQIVYRGNGKFVGTDSFQYTVRDSQGLVSNVGTVTVRVNAPVAADDWTDTDGTTPVNVAVLANDTDPDGNQHIDPAHGAAVTLATPPKHGKATRNADGSFTYTAAAGFTGTDYFSYTVTDDNGGTSMPAYVFVRVNVPTANDDIATFSGTTPVNIAVLANDTDPDGNEHIDPAHGGSVALVSPPAHGRAVLNADGSFAYTAAAGFTGTDSFRYTVTDDAGGTSLPGTVTLVGLTTSGVGNDLADTDGTKPVVIDVLANDTPPNAGAFLPGTVAITFVPGHGRAAVNRTTGAITYTAAAGFRGTDTFGYSVEARVFLGGANPHYVLVTLAGQVSVRVNAPTAADDWTDTDGTTPVNVAVLANDTDPDGNQHIDPAHGGSVALVSGPVHGSVSRQADGSFTYTARPGFSGTDAFYYTVTDDAGATSAPAIVFIRVNVPTAADDFAQTSGTQPVTISVLDNDQDPDGNQHIVAGSVTIVSPPQHGSVTVGSGGQVVYTPNPGWSGTDGFRYTIRDDAGATSAPGTVVVITEAPVAPPGIAVLSGVRTTVFDVLPGATDPAGAQALAGAVLTITVAPRHGQVTVNPANLQVTYVANPGFYGLDTISYTITDGLGVTSKVATLVVDLLPPMPYSLLYGLDLALSQQYQFATQGRLV